MYALILKMYLIGMSLQVRRYADHNRLYPNSANELQKSDFGDGGAGGAQTVHMER